jgi:hypothetical protein
VRSLCERERQTENQALSSDDDDEEDYNDKICKQVNYLLADC